MKRVLGICVLYGPKYAENWEDWLLDNMDYFDIFRKLFCFFA